MKTDRTKKERKNIDLPLKPSDILLPGKSVDLTRWAVVACDQFTQDEAYWKRVSELTKGVPSASHIMLPEIYLSRGKASVSRRIAAINKTMRSYIDGGIFDEYKNSLILTKRTFASGLTLTGLIGAIDLEQYDYCKGSGSAVRATEATVLERIPPRVAIREGASLEMPHILILIDDPDDTVIGPLEAKADSKTPVYDFNLMEGGGHVEGFALTKKAEYAPAIDALRRLGDESVFRQRYGVPEGTPVLWLAVGDGNHSLASAKALYEKTHDPLARYALAEVVNIHSPGIVFEPIHRLLLGVNEDNLVSAARDYFGSSLIISNAGAGGLSGVVNDGDHHAIGFVSKGRQCCWQISRSRHLLAVGALQEFIDAYIGSHPETAVDYIHGESETKALARKPGTAAFLLPGMPKSDLFPTVIRYGALPRKTFSMGHAEEKRYYLECRRLK
ncbi:MAG: DUF1015 domain-containing protein [Clostridia bacterium]|nr:DUF1015 domain-containing protein [Clostridia bacterium]